MKTLHPDNLLRKSARVKAGLSQRKLAHDAGIYTTSLKMIENGEQRCSLLQFVAIGNALDINPGEWLNTAVFRTYIESKTTLMEGINHDV